MFPWRAPWVGLFFLKYCGIDNASNRSLFNLRVWSVGRKHVPQLQYTMLFVQYVRQWGDSLPKDRSTPCSPCCGSCPSTFRWMGCTPDFASSRLSTLLELGAFRIDESTFWLLLHVYGLLVELWSVVVLESDNRFHRDRSSRTCWNGRVMLSLSLFNACSVFSSFKPSRFQYNSLPWTKNFINFVV